MKTRIARLFVLIGVLAQFALAKEAAVHHAIHARVFPMEQTISVVDTLTLNLDPPASYVEFTLHSALTVKNLTGGLTLQLIETNIVGSDRGMDVEAPEVLKRVKQNRYRLKAPRSRKLPRRVVLAFSGKIHHEIQQLAEEYARGFSTTPGIIDSQGVYLSGSSVWLPQFDKRLVTFSLTVEAPAGWDVVSQGKRATHRTVDGARQVRWICDKPMEEVFLIAAKFVEYQRDVGKVKVMAFLRSPDEALANKYLDVTGQYLEMYRKLIGNYPFWKFALVENFWETGYGMPSFTLLGPQVIRFPFILHSSYPHELLHNWWGNGVYVDFKGGNWCEGLTAYLADHLIQEQRGQGDAYRRATLQKYTDYVNETNDFPLAQFLSRHDAPSEAVGYGKCLMLWEMLRTDLGDRLFVKGLRHFYHHNLFKRASFDDLRRSFEKVSGRLLQSFFDQWVKRSGAPELLLAEARVQQNKDTFGLQLQLRQVQKEEPFQLNVPIAVYFEDTVEVKMAAMNERQKDVEWSFQKEPVKVAVDPQFQVFRRLHYSEIPPALSKIFGAGKVLIVLPDGLSADNPYVKLANIWSGSKSKDVQVKAASEVNELPDDRSVWVFGDDNPFKKEIKTALKNYDAQIKADRVQLEKFDLPLANNSFVITVRHPKNRQAALVWLRIGNPQAVKGLARKLPHYGKYSYLAFSGAEPTNIAKGQWPIINSPLQKTLNDKKLPQNVRLKKRPALAQLTPLFSAERMLQDIRYLASEELEGRGLGSEGLEKAARYIAEQFKKAGLQPGADDGTYFQVWPEIVDDQGNKASVKNIIGLIPGTDPHLKDQAVVVSAHYDHLGRGWPDVHRGDEGKIHPGADDNASGVAALLELARVLGQSFKPQRTVIFVAFTAEESGLKGSRYFVKHYRRFPPDKIMADLNLDTVGRLKDNKVMILNVSSAKEWPYIFMGVGHVTGVDAQIVTPPLDASDQVAFIEAGIPAVQIFSGPHTDYHRPSDTVDKINADGLVKSATLTRETLAYLSAERKEPLTFTAKKTAEKSAAAHQGGRKVRTGILPDFAFEGQGVKIKSVDKDSPAARAGLKAGDVIVALGKQPVANLKDYSVLLKKHQAGDVIVLQIKRNGEQKEIRVKLEER
ncbi:peptidase M28 [Caldithrix abyssi DSM 13497]|uniref:PDZ domain-containing protein n=1 Tax=Caldithrix abyssi DSM 13497 TaxID=880073 RepID=H1XRM0_CALAY|nr:M20/M25/M40 family metallo-hydrolase [Caldithrix abyssi]APF20104.1 PDZ domain-containing protein [Caldithrix abyssi DSM 13497]EHO40173.1 peptidase M28 [Caldithrix abyssi DSM 13497]